MGSITTRFNKDRAEDVDEFKDKVNDNFDNTQEERNELYLDVQPMQQQPDNDETTAAPSEGNKCQDLGNICIEVGERQKAIEYYEKALNIAHVKGDKKKEADVYERLGAINNEIGKFQNAAEFYKKSLAIAQELSDKDLERKSYIGLETAYSSVGKHQKAMKYYQKSKVIGLNAQLNQTPRETDSNAEQHQTGIKSRAKAQSMPRRYRAKTIGESSHERSNEYSKKAITLSRRQVPGNLQTQPRDAHIVTSGVHNNIAAKSTDDEPSDQERQKVEWRKISTKHRTKFKKLVEILETNPSAATTIGTYSVCLENEFAIGKGSNGTTVYIGLSYDGIEVAVKSIPMNICQELGPNEKEILNCSNVKKEQHIVNYRFYTDSMDHMHGYLVLDLHEESLKDYVKERSKEELNRNGPTIVSQVSCGLQALHCGKEEILHRDLKPSNILVSSDGEFLLADFGISRKLREGQTTYRSGQKGTENWIAVESLPADDSDDELSGEDTYVRYKKQSDIQVTGMLFFYILTKGEHPYGKPNCRRFNLSEGNPVNLGKLGDPVAKDLIEWMLQHDPKNRPGVQQCLKHPYLLTKDEQFNFVTRIGNEPEIKTNDVTSPLVQQLNVDPSLSKPNWKTKIDAEVMTYLSGHRAYSDDTADLLRLIRNTAEHWHDTSPPITVQLKVGKPRDYFLNLFPALPVVLHGIIRNNSDWSKRDQLKQFFM